MATAIERGPEVIVTAPAWAGMKPNLKRALVARALGTQDSARIDVGVRHFDAALGGRPSGEVSNATATGLTIAAVLATAVAIGLGVMLKREKRGHRSTEALLRDSAARGNRAEIALDEAEAEIRARVAELESMRGEIDVLHASREAAEAAWHDAERKLRDARTLAEEQRAAADVARAREALADVDHAIDESTRETGELSERVVMYTMGVRDQADAAAATAAEVA